MGAARLRRSDGLISTGAEGRRGEGAAAADGAVDEELRLPRLWLCGMPLLAGLVLLRLAQAMGALRVPGAEAGPLWPISTGLALGLRW